MLTDLIIEDFDVFKAGRVHRIMASVAEAVIALVLKAVKPAFRWRVVPITAHRADHAKLFELVLDGMAGILTAAIRMMHHAHGRSTAKPCYRQAPSRRRHDRAIRALELVFLK